MFKKKKKKSEALIWANSFCETTMIDITQPHTPTPGHSETAFEWNGSINTRTMLKYERFFIFLGQGKSNVQMAVCCFKWLFVGWQKSLGRSRDNKRKHPPGSKSWLFLTFFSHCMASTRYRLTARILLWAINGFETDFKLETPTVTKSCANLLSSIFSKMATLHATTLL